MDMDIDTQLLQDCYVLGRLEHCHLLLLNNAHFPWFILVPQTQHTEFHHLDAALQQQLLNHMNTLSLFIEQHFSVSKINTACIGNIVRQLHIHVIGRRTSDPCWPGVVWGRAPQQAYALDEVHSIQSLLASENALSLELCAVQAKT